MNNRMLINMVPGDTFLHKLSGSTKVRLFVVLLVFIIMSFDLRLLLPLFILSSIALISLRPSWKLVLTFLIAVLIMNLFNIFLYWLVDPAIGEVWTGNTHTVLLTLSGRYFIGLETVWYLSIRLLKMYTSFMVSMVFILSITPSEMASGLYSMKVPYKICTVVSLAFRYIPDIGRDYENIKISMQARGVEMDNKKAPLMKRLKQTVLILVPLIITSFERVGDISNAMDLRGYGRLKQRSYYSEIAPQPADKIINWLTIGLALFCAYWIVTQNIFPQPTKMWFPFSV